MRTVLEIACTGTEIQDWIAVRRCDFGSNHATRVPGNAENVGLDALVPSIGSLVRTSTRRSDSVAVVVLQHTTLAFTAPNRAFIFELIHCREFAMNRAVVMFVILEVFSIGCGKEWMEECSSNSECKSGLFCANWGWSGAGYTDVKFCTMACTDDAECQNEFATSDAYCGTTCKELCNSDEDCPGSFVCDGGECLPHDFP